MMTGLHWQDEIDVIITHLERTGRVDIKECSRAGWDSGTCQERVPALPPHERPTRVDTVAVDSRFDVVICLLERRVYFLPENLLKEAIQRHMSRKSSCLTT